MILMKNKEIDVKEDINNEDPWGSMYDIVHE